MIIRILISFLFISIGGFSFTAQVDSTNTNQDYEQSAIIGNDEVNIREIVNQQVEASRQKQFNEFMMGSLNRVIAVEGDGRNNVEKTQVSKAIMFDVADLSVLIFLAAVVLSVIVIIINRIRNRNLIAEKNNLAAFSLDMLKKNIAMIRNEDPKLNRKESYLADKRKNLQNVSLNNLKKDISGTAKKLQLSKGEILLSSNIKNYERKKTWSKMRGIKRTKPLAGI